MEMAGKEEVGAERGDVLWQVPDGNVKVPAPGHRSALRHRLAPGHSSVPGHTAGSQRPPRLALPGDHWPTVTVLCSPAHLKGLRQAGVQVEVVPDHAPGSMALPVQDAIVDLVGHTDRHQREFLQDRNLTGQPLQLPVGLNGDERGPPALLLGQGTMEEKTQVGPASKERRLTAGSQPPSPCRRAGIAGWLCRWSSGQFLPELRRYVWGAAGAQGPPSPGGGRALLSTGRQGWASGCCAPRQTQTVAASPCVGGSGGSPGADSTTAMALPIQSRQALMGKGP